MRRFQTTIHLRIGYLWIACITVTALGSLAAADSDRPLATSEPDWPQWRGPRRDGVTDETGLLSSWPQGGPKCLWTIDGLGRGWSSPIVVGDRLYVTGDVEDDLIIYAFDLDATPLWKVTNGRSWQKSYDGARACCAYSDGRIYNMNAHGRVTCLDAATGKEQWAVNILDRFEGENIRWAVSECLLIDGDHLIVTPGGKKALMAALDKTTGKTIWTTEPLGDDVVSHCSPILFEHGGYRQIANCSSAHGFGVDAETGKLLWTAPLENKYGTNISTPVYHDGRIFLMTPYTQLGRQYSLDVNGKEITARLTWTHPVDAVTGSGIVVDGRLYAAGYHKTRWWHVIDWATGQEIQELKQFTTGAAIYADGHLYLQDQEGQVALLKPVPTGLEIVSQFELVEKHRRDVWAHPVLLNGRLYLRYHDRLFCYDVKADNP